VVASKANDYATTSLIEVWIDEAERRAWFLFESNAVTQPRRVLKGQGAPGSQFRGLRRCSIVRNAVSLNTLLTSCAVAPLLHYANHPLEKV